MAAAALAGAIIEIVVIRRLYSAAHLDQVLATFALILIFSEGTRWVFGSFPLFLDIPEALSGPVTLPGGIQYPLYRLALIAIGLAVAVGLWALIERTRIGIQIRAGENDREMIGALGVDISKLYTLVFALGAGLAGLSGALVGAIQSVQVGMGEPVLILAFVVIVIGGIGSIRGAFVGALLVGLTDTLGGVFLPELFAVFMETSAAQKSGSALASMSIYILMGLVLIWRPTGLFGGADMRIEERFVNATVLVGLLGVPLWALMIEEPFTITLATRAVILALAAVGLNVILGVGGLVSFGHAIFFGIGGYAMGILAFHAQTYSELDLGLFSTSGTNSMPVIWLVAMGFSAFSAFLIGLLTLRTSGVYFIMITLAFGQMFYYFAISWPSYGGEDGLSIYVRNGFPGLNTLVPFQFFCALFCDSVRGAIYLRAATGVTIWIGAELCASISGARRNCWARPDENTAFGFCNFRGNHWVGGCVIRRSQQVRFPHNVQLATVR